jgi:hypothetical protein
LWSKEYIIESFKRSGGKEMKQNFFKELDTFLLNNKNCDNDEREEIMKLVNKFDIEEK